jgi:hypothetical protein
MASVLELVQKHGKGKSWNLKRGDYIFERILSKTDQFLVYDTQSKKKPLYTIAEEKFEEEWIHSTVIRLTKLLANDSGIKSLFDLFETRKKIDYEKCPHLVTFHDQGVIQWQDKIYYACRYDDPCRDFNYWINVDHQGLEIEALDCFRIARGCLEAFNYLEGQNLWLNQFNDKNLYVGSFSEDRGNFFRIMFKGDSTKPSSFKLERGQFAPPESETNDLYKSYAFSVGLMILWAIYTTNNKGGEFPSDIHKDTSKLSEIIKNAVEICYKEGKEKPDHKDMFKVFLEDLLEPNVEKRRKASELLTYKWIVESDKLDYEEYQREVEENERAKQKEKEEEEKNKFN